MGLRSARGERLTIARTIGKHALACLLPLAGSVLFVILLSSLDNALHAQSADPSLTYYYRSRSFSIPILLDRVNGPIQSVRLYLSEDFGRSWHPIATAQPGLGNRNFRFQGTHDGHHWFAVQTVYADNHLAPAVMDANVQPSLKMCIDTQRPELLLDPLSLRDGKVGVKWRVQDENLKFDQLDNFILDYRVVGTSQWKRLGVTPEAIGEKVWDPETNAALEVRLLVRDAAGNEMQALTTVIANPNGPMSDPAATGGRFNSWQHNSPTAQPSTPPSGQGPAVQITNSKRIGLNYDIKDIGKSGAIVELWVTQNTNNWQKLSEKVNPQPPYIYEVDIEREGTYGLSLIARSGVGLGEQPPKVGDAPQVWIKADWTKPEVRLVGIDVGRGPDVGKLAITYTARDENMDTEGCITFLYAERPEGPWIPFAQKQSNTGRYIWQMPADVPYQFYIKVKATDKAGNEQEDQSAEPVKVDLSRPQARVLGIKSIQK